MRKGFVGLTERAKEALSTTRFSHYEKRSTRKKAFFCLPVKMMVFRKEVEKPFNHSYSLHKYTSPSGRVYFERVQPMACNPDAVFLALQREDGSWVKKSLWTPKEALQSIIDVPEIYNLEELGGVQLQVSAF